MVCVRKEWLFEEFWYAGLMWTVDGPKVLEFNVRFGDPECQPLMMMMDEDLLPWLEGAVEVLNFHTTRWHNGAACCVVMVSGGIPDPLRPGSVIQGIPAPSESEMVFYAGARRDGDEVVNSGAECWA